MAIHKLALEEFDQIDYHLIAIHTTIEDYRLAYQINKNLELVLTKNLEDVTVLFNGQKAVFSRFTFQDQENQVLWNLIQNKQEIELPIVTAQENLFSDNFLITTITLLSELKKVDFFLKIEHDNQIEISKIIGKITPIGTISLAYEIDIKKIKSKNNLIF